MTALEVLESHRSEIVELCRRYCVTRLRVFGSATRPDWNPDTSDFDFLAEFGPPPPPDIDLFKQQFGLLVDLEALLSRRVDLIEFHPGTRPWFRQIVDSEAVEWYAA
ncbi:MAG: nucleotidyltransferase domain-containing protein [Fimbriimonas ginsengisoli]|uniref:Nucleotidyltransferase domain-containing protein n=1 Tax=Fimbriimonas ginsengisoli TaxID=1005039 RepID=A0A931LT42_FIMGI|nr:nucleotidyltransferase domain-containing protein [Fimbriimonas ginsengisoli]